MDNNNKITRQIKQICGLALLGGVASSSALAATTKSVSPVDVNITGAPKELSENIKAFLPSLRTIDCASTQARIDRYIDASSEKLLEGAEALGYFESQATMTARRRGDCWVLDVKVKAGQVVRVDKVSIDLLGEGLGETAFQKLLTSLPYKTGDVLISQDYDDYKSKLKRTANSLGFFDAELTTHQILVNLRTHTADITLVFQTGDRYKIGAVSVDQELLANKYIRRYINIREGEWFSSAELIKQQRILENSGYYKTVQVTSDYQKASNKMIPVGITTTKRKRYTYKGALGFATDDGAYFETSMDTHWLNNKGHQLNLTARLSQQDPSVGLNYKVPLWSPEHEFSNFSLGWERSDNDDIRGTAFKAGFDYHRRNSSDWEQTASLSYLNEETQVDGEDATRSYLTLLGVNVRKTKRDHALFPTKGWRLDVGIKGAAENILSDQSVLQGEIKGKRLHTFDHKGKLITQANLGYTLVGDFDEMPKSLRFFAGGQNSVRGYSFESLGETDADGDLLGGKQLLTTSLEYEYPVYDKISAAAFIDTGNAFDDWGNYTLNYGYGVGARYKSPLGPIRADFAVPHEDTSDLHFYFSLGPDL
ncbi:MAG: Outer membrane protein assembly factor YaeT precursor [uncultured Thiotrichaceae bacterium]|uniref:Translocation and assembly module subunit TamA n=1 Tax=uncultured Thiotrichaceae bacterium TaxID=298394 RepID=A0A6S6TN59_9GAMM|nr:MAG: Outer membrane protein assembly factor YaeT precursor [uncultured Thiotrichaceae bacterium]